MPDVINMFFKWFWRFIARFKWEGITLLAYALATVVSISAAEAAEQAATDQVTARLIAETPAVHPGAAIYLGVQQIIIPHWHTYWVNPGDSGNATIIEWELPAGASASEILWPAPGRISMGPITNYGYENEVTLLSRIKVPENLRPGVDSFAVKAVVDWLVCEEECIPQQVSLDLALPVLLRYEVPREKNPLITEALARLPVASPWPVRAFVGTAGKFQLALETPEGALAQLADAWFYPFEWGHIRQSDPQALTLSTSGLELTLPAGEAPLGLGSQLAGVLVLTEEGGATRSFEVRPTLAATPMGGSGVPGLATALLLALAGGIILNLMPCVFPVLSLKALSLIGQSGQSQTSICRHGLVYTLGVLASFGLLAVVLIVLKAGGAQIGWGFQFQSPLFVLLTAYLMFAVGLSLSGVFYFGGSVAGLGSGLANKSGYAGSFFAGVLATVVATPCTAPFMAAALGYALTQPPAQLLAVFLSLGLGLALPYLLLSWWPGSQRWLPRPGAWMDKLKQAMAFPMYAAAVWLIWVLARQAGADAAALALGGIVLIGFAAWLHSATRNSGASATRLGSVFAGLAVLLALGGGYSAVKLGVPAQTNAQASHNWQAFDNARLQVLLDEGKPVFLNFTAAWCISCLVNERVALSHARVVDAFAADDITYLKGDWTNRDPAITAFLASFGRSGVPLYLFYPAGKSSEPVQLPQILTPDIVLATVRAEKAQTPEPTSLSATAINGGRTP